MSLLDRIIGLFQEDWIEDFKGSTGEDAPEKSPHTAAKETKKTSATQPAHPKAFIQKSKTPQNIFSNADEANPLIDDTTSTPPLVVTDDALFETILDDFFTEGKIAQVESEAENEFAPEETSDVLLEAAHSQSLPPDESEIAITGEPAAEARDEIAEIEQPAEPVRTEFFIEKEPKNELADDEPAVRKTEALPEIEQPAEPMRTELPGDTSPEDETTDMDQAFDEINAMLDQGMDSDESERGDEIKKGELTAAFPENHPAEATLSHPQAETDTAVETEPLINSEESSSLQTGEALPDSQNSSPQNGDEALLNRLKNGAKAWNEWRKANPGTRLNLRGTNLRGLDLSMMILDNIDFQNADFQGACLWNTRFVRANLSGANLSEAELCETSFQQADLRGARMDGAKIGLFLFDGVNMKQADLRGVNLAGLNLESLNLTDAVTDRDEIPV